jgi:hypothetical protein
LRHTPTFFLEVGLTRDGMAEAGVAAVGVGVGEGEGGGAGLKGVNGAQPSATAGGPSGKKAQVQKYMSEPGTMGGGEGSSSAEKTRRHVVVGQRRRRPT